MSFAAAAGRVGRVELDDRDANREEDEREPFRGRERVLEEQDRKDGSREEFELCNFFRCTLGKSASCCCRPCRMDD